MVAIYESFLVVCGLFLFFYCGKLLSVLERQSSQKMGTFSVEKNKKKVFAPTKANFNCWFIVTCWYFGSNVEERK